MEQQSEKTRESDLGGDPELDVEENPAPVQGDTVARICRRTGGRATALLAVLITVALVVPVWGLAEVLYVGSLPVGREYWYSYDMRVSDGGSNFTLIVPIPMTDAGGVVQGVDFEATRLGDLSVVDTPHGPGLRIRSDGPLTFRIGWRYDALHESPDRVSDGCPLPSMTVLDQDRNIVCGISTVTSDGSAWIWSDVGGLNVSLQFERVWGTQRDGESLLISTSQTASSGNNGILFLFGETETVIGWGSFPVELESAFMTE